MDEIELFLEALTDPDFMFFIDDLSFSYEMKLIKLNTPKGNTCRSK